MIPKRSSSFTIFSFFIVWPASHTYFPMVNHIKICTFQCITKTLYNLDSVYCFCPISPHYKSLAFLTILLKDVIFCDRVSLQKFFSFVWKHHSFSRKRRQKECKRQKPERRARKCCLLVMIQTLQFQTHSYCGYLNWPWATVSLGWRRVSWLQIRFWDRETHSLQLCPHKWAHRTPLDSSKPMIIIDG